jgi:hypothetical protein
MEDAMNTVMADIIVEAVTTTMIEADIILIIKL